MAKKSARNTQSTKKYIFYLWLAGLVPFAFWILVQQRFLHIDDAVFLIPVSLFGLVLLSFILPSRKKNNIALLITASAGTLYNALMVFDIWSEVHTKDICGTGFNTGNCFMADGLGTIWYIFLFTIVLFVTNVLLSINIALKNK